MKDWQANYSRIRVFKSFKSGEDILTPHNSLIINVKPINMAFLLCLGNLEDTPPDLGKCYQAGENLEKMSCLMVLGVGAYWQYIHRFSREEGAPTIEVNLEEISELAKIELDGEMEKSLSGLPDDKEIFFITRVKWQPLHYIDYGRLKGFTIFRTRFAVTIVPIGSIIKAPEK